MKRFVASLVIVVLCALLVVLTAVSGQNSSGSGKFRRVIAEKRIHEQYIVVLKNDADPDLEAERLSREHSGDRSGGYTYHKAIKGFSVRMPEAAALRMANDPRVEFIEEDSEVQTVATQTGATFGLDRIDQRDLPLDGNYTYNATGLGVTAYIIDTGIRATHTEYAGRVISGFTAINDGNGTNDCNGHGSHVAGTVGGSTFGVAKNVTLVAVRVLDCNGSGTTSGVIAGVDFVTSDHQAGRPAVANMSLGGSASSSLDTAVNNSINDGVTYAIAAGNSNVDACNSSPARVPNAITVGATTITDARSSFSNFGTCVDIFAPGSNITSSWNTSDIATNTISGTSMATPHVSGVAALFLESNPGASPATVIAAIINSSTPNKVSNPGSGSPNRLLYSLLTGSPPPTPTPTPSPTPVGESPNNTRVPTASQIVDSNGDVWTRTTSGAILRNGASTSGAGSQILYCNHIVFALGTDAQWWRWASTFWTPVGAVDPCGGSTPTPTPTPTPTATPTPTPTPTPAPVGESPNNTRVPTASQIVDSNGDVWTRTSSGAILRNGAATGGAGPQILYCNHIVFAFGTDSQWWRWASTFWTPVGAVDPCGGSTSMSTPSPTLTPTPAQTSAPSDMAFTLYGGRATWDHVGR